AARWPDTDAVWHRHARAIRLLLPRHDLCLLPDEAIEVSSARARWAHLHRDRWPAHAGDPQHDAANVPPRHAALGHLCLRNSFRHAFHDDRVDGAIPAHGWFSIGFVWLHADECGSGRWHGSRHHRRSGLCHERGRADDGLYSDYLLASMAPAPRAGTAGRPRQGISASAALPRALAHEDA